MSDAIELEVAGQTVRVTSPDKVFFSNERGSNQRLANGNTMITESDRGRVFEVTPGGDVVWQFLNPHVRRKTKTRMAIWRMTRHPADWLRFDVKGL